MPAPASAVAQQVIWKNEEVHHFAVALVRAALNEAYPDDDSPQRYV